MQKGCLGGSGVLCKQWPHPSHQGVAAGAGGPNKVLCGVAPRGAHPAAWRGPLPPSRALAPWLGNVSRTGPKDVPHG